MPDNGASGSAIINCFALNSKGFAAGNVSGGAGNSTGAEKRLIVARILKPNPEMMTIKTRIPPPALIFIFLIFIVTYDFCFYYCTASRICPVHANEGSVVSNQSSVVSNEGLVVSNQGLVGVAESLVGSNQGLVGVAEGLVASNQGLVGVAEGLVGVE
ncbi:MAG: hypothetical protein LBP64_09370 [Tannerella sp.]|nr:hypothetical protein [Tannerella sp.]